MRIGVGVSTASDARQAAVEATAYARDELASEAPSLAVLLGSRLHTDKAVDVLDTVQHMIEPPALICCVAQAIVAGRREIEDEPAMDDLGGGREHHPEQPAAVIRAAPMRAISRH